MRPLRSLAVIRDANVVQLDVDSEVDHVVGPVSLGPAHSPKPVFVGGAPGEPRTNPVVESGLFQWRRSDFFPFQPRTHLRKKLHQTQ